MTKLGEASPRMPNRLPCVHEVRRRFSYDVGTGALVHLNPYAAHNIKRGDRAGHKNTSGHLQVEIDHVSYLVHRLAWLHFYGKEPSGFVDHINGVKHDNRIENLREADTRLNCENLRKARKDSTSGLLGVFPSSSKINPWVAQIRVDGKRIYLGIFPTKELAHEAYINAKRQFHKGCTL